MTDIAVIGIPSQYFMCMLHHNSEAKHICLRKRMCTRYLDASLLSTEESDFGTFNGIPYIYSTG